QRLLLPLAFHELPDQRTDARRHLHQVRVRWPNLLVEELDDSEDLVPGQEGKGEAGVQPHLGGNRRPWEIAVHEHVRNPGRLSARPHTTGKTDAVREGELAAGRLKRLPLHGRRLPEVEAAQLLPLRIEEPDATDLPAQVL